MNRWVGTYNTYLIHITRFFKWLYAQDTAAKERKKPAVVDNIPKLHRKQTSIYKPSDMWTPEDDLLFLSYCPSKRDRCYHAISRDLSARPAEILSLKIKDAVFKTVASGRQYCEVTVNGKTGERHLPLINSLPYLKDYLDDHPMRNNPHAPFICGIGKSLGRHLTPIGIFKMYAKYKEEVFPKLLESPNVLPGDKQRITELLKKRWNPYVRRHSSLTEKSVFLKENVLRQYAGWTQDSQMHKRYLHYFGNEATNNILEEYGLIDKSKQLNPLQPKQCPNCSESNKPDSKFCSRCRMVLSYDSYNEVIQQQEKQQMEMERLDDLVRDLATIKERLGIQ